MRRESVKAKNFRKRRSQSNIRRIRRDNARRFKSSFERDLSAMSQVWRMLKEGTLRAFGEIGRQY